MTGYQWALLYFAPGAAWLAWGWHNDPKLESFHLEIRRLYRQIGVPPVLADAGLVIALLMLLAVWPLVACTAAVLAIRGRLRR